MSLKLLLTPAYLLPSIRTYSIDSLKNMCFYLHKINHHNSSVHIDFISLTIYRFSFLDNFQQKTKKHISLINHLCLAVFLLFSIWKKENFFCENNRKMIRAFDWNDIEHNLKQIRILLNTQFISPLSDFIRSNLLRQQKRFYITIDEIEIIHRK